MGLMYGYGSGRRLKGKLKPNPHQRLRLLAGGPRCYADGDRENLRLMKLGFIEPTGGTSADGAPEWAITASGRIVLEAHEAGEP